MVAVLMEPIPVRRDILMWAYILPPNTTNCVSDGKVHVYATRKRSVSLRIVRDTGSYWIREMEAPGSLKTVANA
jgi:hypothetical protein